MAHESDGCRTGRHGIDPLAFVVGIGALFVSAFGFSGGTGWLAGVDARWLLAAGAVLVGLLMLSNTLGRSRDRSG